MLNIILSTLAVGSFAFSTLKAEEATLSPIDLSDQLEEAIFLQEAKADLSGAIEKYQEILKAETVIQSIAAEAQFRLAGCYWEQGNKHQAEIEYQKLKKNYPESSDWIETANLHLPQAFTPQTSPFVDGERYAYEYILPTGKTIGYSVAINTKVNREGRILWRRENQTVVGGQRLVFAEFDPVTFDSVYSGVVSDHLGNVQCAFGSNATSANLTFAKTGEEKEFSFSQKSYDNEQAIELLRQLPVELGHRGKLNVFVIFVGVQVTIPYEIEEILEMDTVLGPRECYKVVLDLGATKQQFYITNDEKRIIAKMDAGVDIHLIKADRYEPGTTRMFTYNSDYGTFSFQHPDEWYPIMEKEVVHFFTPSGIAKSELRTNLKNKLPFLVPDDLKTTAKEFFEEIQKEVSDFIFDQQTLSFHTVNGLNTIYFQGVRKEDNEIAERYAVGLVLGHENYYKMTLRASASDWDTLESDFYSIIESITE